MGRIANHITKKGTAVSGFLDCGTEGDLIYGAMDFATFSKYLQVDTSDVLFACESGSRMWNATAADSDYDIRIIYRRPRQYYLTLHEPKDNFEVSIKEVDLDIAAWDVKKTLRLAQKSNPSLLEWLQSPVIYREQGSWTEQLRQAMKDFSPRAAMHHYASMAATQANAYWKPNEPVRLKKYVYLLRPLACLLWMRNHNYTMPPMDWNLVLSETPEISQAVKDESKITNERRAVEGDGALGRLAALDGFIEEYLVLGHVLAEKAPVREPDAAALQRLFDLSFDLT